MFKTKELVKEINKAARYEDVTVKIQHGEDYEDEGTYLVIVSTYLDDEWLDDLDYETFETAAAAEKAAKKVHAALKRSKSLDTNVTVHAVLHPIITA